MSQTPYILISTTRIHNTISNHSSHDIAIFSDGVSSKTTDFQSTQTEHVVFEVVNGHLVKHATSEVAGNVRQCMHRIRAIEQQCPLMKHV